MKTSTSSARHTPILQRRLPVMTAAWGTCGGPWLGTLAFLLGWLALPARADINWDGDDPVGNFSSCDNWYSDTCPNWGFDSGNLVFSSRNNGSQTSLYYDLGWSNINDIIWETTFGAGLSWNGSGNGINFNQRVENRSSYAQTVNIPLSGARNGAPQIELNPVNGDLTISGSISNDNNKPFYSYGSNARMLTIGVGLAGDSSVGFTVAAGSGGGCGKVKLTAAQSWGDSAHGVSVNQGELWIDANGSLKTGIPVSLGLADANPAKLWLSAAGGGTTFPQSITVANNGGTKVLGGLNTSGTHTFTNNITLNGPVNLVADQPGGAVEFKTGVIGGSGSVNINNTATSAGKVILSGTNTYTGGTTLSAGQLNINNSQALGTVAGTFTIFGGTIDNTSSAAITTLNYPQAWNGDFAFTGTKDLNLGAGAVTPNASRQITVNAGKLTVGGIIGGGAISLTKPGAGTLVLTAANTFTGGTTLTAGQLNINNAQALGTVAGTFTIFGGAIDNTSSAAITTLNYPQAWNGDFAFTGTKDLNLGAGAVTPSGDRTISVNASNLTVGGVIGGGAIKLTKNGGGTLTLAGSANNTYSGLTTVNGGTLSLGMTTAGLNAFGGDLTINNGGTVNYSSSSSNQIPDTANVTLNSHYGTLDFGRRCETIGRTNPSAAGGFTMNDGYVSIENGTVQLAGSIRINAGTILVWGAGTLEADQEVIFNGGTIDFSTTSGTGWLNLHGGDGTGITYQSSGTNTALISHTSGNGKISLNADATTVFKVEDSPTVNTELRVEVPMANTGTTSAIRKEGAGRLLLVSDGTHNAASTYTGPTTINSGTLALGIGGAINHSASISIAAGAAFDVSASGFTFTGSDPQQTLAGSSTSGTATITAGTGAKKVTLASGALLSFQAAGGAGTTVGKISVTNDLALNANAVTVNVSGSALVAGSCRLLDCTGTLTNTGTFGTPTIAGMALSSGYAASIGVTTGSSGHVDLIVKATPAFSGLTASPSISYGATSVTLSGTVSSTGGPTTVYPATGDPVSATISSHTVSGTVNNSTGGFSITYNDPSLATNGAGAYTITYAYAGNSSQFLNAAANNTSTSLTVNKRAVTLSGSRNYDGTATAAASILTIGNNLDGGNLTLSGSATLAGSGHGSQNISSFAGLSLGGSAAGNYTLTGASGSVTINALAAQLSGTRAYNGSATADYSILSVANAISPDPVNVASGSGTLAGANTGSRAITSFGNLALGNNTAGDYTLTGGSGSVTITAASTTNSVAASPNPSLPGADVTFTAAPGAVAPGAGTPTGAINFKTNKVSLCDPISLDGNSVATLSANSFPHGATTLTAEYAGDGNFLGSTDSVVQVVNTPPVAQDKTLTTLKNTPNSLSIGKLLVGAADADGDGLSVSAVSNPSTYGGTVVLADGKATYTPATDFVGADTFTFTVSDGNGGTGSATVTVTVSENAGASPNVVYGPTLDGNEFVVRFAGVPGTTFTVEYTESLPPNTSWTKLGSLNYTAPGVNDSHPFGVGVFEVRDTVGSSSRYYRTVYPPY